MTNNNHTITPPPELVHQWHKIACKDPYNGGTFFDSKVLKSIATQAARWGYEQRAANNEDELQKARDEQLDACCDWLEGYESEGWAAEQMRNACRPKPPSLKEQALAVVENSAVCDHLSIEHAAILRRALEALDD